MISRFLTMLIFLLPESSGWDTLKLSITVVRMHRMWLSHAILFLLTALATNWDLDERYFYYLAFIQESNSSFLCKRELDGGYVKEICPFIDQTNLNHAESQFKFYIKFLHQEKRASSAMIFNKASRRAMTIHPQNNLDRQPPVLIVQPENPRCNADQVLALQTAPREKFPIVIGSGGTYTPFYVSGPEYCQQVSSNKHSCLVQLINNSVLHINADGHIRNDVIWQTGNIVYMLKSNEIHNQTTHHLYTISSFGGENQNFHWTVTFELSPLSGPVVASRIPGLSLSKVRRKPTCKN